MQWPSSPQAHIIESKMPKWMNMIAMHSPQMT